MRSRRPPRGSDLELPYPCAHVEIHGGRASLTSGSARLELQIVSPRGAHFEYESASPPPPQGQQPDVTNLIIRLPGREMLAWRSGSRKRAMRSFRALGRFPSG